MSNKPWSQRKSKVYDPNTRSFCKWNIQRKHPPPHSECENRRESIYHRQVGESNPLLLKRNQSPWFCFWTSAKTQRLESQQTEVVPSISGNLERFKYLFITPTLTIIQTNLNPKRRSPGANYCVTIYSAGQRRLWICNRKAPKFRNSVDDNKIWDRETEL